MVSGQRIWNFSTFISECTNSPRSFSGNSAEQQHDLVDSCSRMVVQLHDVYDPEKASSSTSFNQLVLTMSSLSLLLSNILIFPPPKTLSQVKIRIKIISGSPSGAVAAEAKRIKATWVILDK